MGSTSDLFSAGADVYQEGSVVSTWEISKTRKPPRKSTIPPWLEYIPNSTKRNPKRTNTQPWLACTLVEAQPYEQYKKLYNERKFARDFPKEKQNLSFSDDLPVEIRLQVYEYLFDIPNNFFELWAPKEWAREGHWAKNSSKALKSLRTRLRVMRLCKKIREEAADYFYGGNNFRFTNSNGFLVMTAFNHTIRPANCSFLKHITVQIPNRMRESHYDEGVVSKTGWRKFDQLLARRGMRVPNYGVWIKRGKRKFRIQGEGADTYNRAVLKGFRQLRSMPSLKLLEITIPWTYRLNVLDYWDPSPDETTHCCCQAEDVEAMCPERRIRHTIEDHLQGPHYWALLADLKENAASEDLSISLVIHYGSDRLELELAPELLRHPDRMRQARWIAAYAALMGYGFGCTWWETEGPPEGPQRGTYRVRYQEDPLLELARDPEDEEENPLLEPPELPEYQEEPENSELPA